MSPTFLKGIFSTPRAPDEGDIKGYCGVYAEMKGCGFDVRAVRQIVRVRKQDHSGRKGMEAILELYMSTLNMN